MTDDDPKPEPLMVTLSISIGTQQYTQLIPEDAAEEIAKDILLGRPGRPFALLDEHGKKYFALRGKVDTVRLLYNPMDIRDRPKGLYRDPFNQGWPPRPFE